MSTDETQISSTALPQFALAAWLLIVLVVLWLWSYDCSKIGYIGYIVECQLFNRQHFGNMKSYKKLHYRYRGLGNESTFSFG